jgi:uroporphyrinogen-III synthase
VGGGRTDLSRIAVTRPAGLDESLVEGLRALGHEVVSCPLIAVEPLGNDPIDASGYDWLVVTSRNGAQELGRRLTGRPLRVAAVGPGTAEALRAGGLPVDLVPSVASQEGLIDELPRPPGRVLLTAAEGARGVLADAVGADFLPLYRTRELRPARFPDADLVVLASASAARAYAALSRSAPAVSIGPQTTAAARAAGVDVVAEAARADLGGLLEAVALAAR